MRAAAILSTVVLSAGLVAGCGGSDGNKTDDDSTGGGSTTSSGSYCADLTSATADFATLGSDTPDFTKFDEAIDTFHELAAIAPSEVSTEWKTLDSALTMMRDTFEDAGLSLADLATIMTGQRPDGMSQEDLEALGPKLQAAFEGYSEDDFDKAIEAIEKHAKDACDIDLDAG